MFQVTDLMQENAMLKGKLLNLNGALTSTELETKASRETIMRLVSEVGREQKVATRYTSEIENIRMVRYTSISLLCSQIQIHHLTTISWNLQHRIF